ncbi:MAG: rRNA maturation RNase YbeY [Parcubacteria group bacterium]|nr:rRNA maturation RNase YbeY [Parcubacteria group bacterium]
MKNKVLGPKYELSLVFSGDTLTRRLNKEYRGKDYVPNVLTFPLDSDEGEIFINPNISKRDAKKFEMGYKNFIGYLFIHGMLHLKGYKHGSTMNKQERTLLKHFNLS